LLPTPSNHVEIGNSRSADGKDGVGYALTEDRLDNPHLAVSAKGGALVALTVGWVFAESRGTDEIAAQMRTFSGILQVDGYGAYEALAQRRRKTNGGPIRLAHCLAHARRKFVAVGVRSGVLVSAPFVVRCTTECGFPILKRSL